MNALAEASANQPRVGVALGAAISEGPSHAYLLRGPSGSGKSRIARAFAAEILASDSTDPEETRRRALQDPSPHPDLIWPDGVSFSPDGWMYVSAAQLSEVPIFNDGNALQKPPYYIFRFRPIAPGRLGH